MLSTDIDLAEALMSVQQMSPGDWGDISKMCMQALIQSETSHEQPLSLSEESSCTEDSSKFGLNPSMHPLEETMIPSIPSTSSASDAATICSSFTASLTNNSTTNYCPSFYPGVPANAMRPSITLLFSSIASKDSDSETAHSVPTSASPTSSTADSVTTTSEDTFPSPTPSTPRQVPMDIPSRCISELSVSSQSSSVSTVSKPSYYREHTYTSPPAEPVKRVSNRHSQSPQYTSVPAQPTLSSEKPSSHEMVTSIRQPPVQVCRFVPYSATDRPPTLATRVLTSSSSFSFADQTFSPKPYIPSKCPVPTANESEKQSFASHSKVFCRKGKYDQLVAKLGINDHTLYYGWKTDYVTCYISGCNKATIKNTRAEVSKHVKSFHLCAQDSQFVVRDCCPFASASDRFIKVDMVYGHFQTERHSFVHDSYQYSCGYCGNTSAKPEQLDNHFFECRTLHDHVLSLRSAWPQASFYPTTF
ncbi:hypothetical protein DFS33DRAFT_1277558 [Desarmillaria ectypa]|nr:hypothetical protein DFS33DRAFT_1277558 [Desarmillaria ectypa]